MTETFYCDKCKNVIDSVELTTGQILDDIEMDTIFEFRLLTVLGYNDLVHTKYYKLKNKLCNKCYKEAIEKIDKIFDDFGFEIGQWDKEINYNRERKLILEED